MTYLAIIALAILGMFAANALGYRAGVEAGREQAQREASRRIKRDHVPMWWGRN